MHLLILLPLVDFRMGILVALAPPQAGIVASEDCLLPLPLALSWKVRIFIPKWSQFSAKRTTCCIWSRIVGVWWVHSTVYNIRTQKEVNISVVCAAHTNFQFKHCFLYIKIITALKKQTNMWLLICLCRHRQCLSGAGQPVAQRRGRSRGRSAVFNLGVLLWNLQRVPVRPTGRLALPAAPEESHIAAKRRQAGQPLRER